MTHNNITHDTCYITLHDTCYITEHDTSDII